MRRPIPHESEPRARMYAAPAAIIAYKSHHNDQHRGVIIQSDRRNIPWKFRAIGTAIRVVQLRFQAREIIEPHRAEQVHKLTAFCEPFYGCLD